MRAGSSSLISPYLPLTSACLSLQRSLMCILPTLFLQLSSVRGSTRSDNRTLMLLLKTIRGF